MEHCDHSKETHYGLWNLLYRAVANFDYRTLLGFVGKMNV